jgi:hypothetical protein
MSVSIIIKAQVGDKFFDIEYTEQCIEDFKKYTTNPELELGQLMFAEYEALKKRVKLYELSKKAETEQTKAKTPTQD